MNSVAAARKRADEVGTEYADGRATYEAWGAAKEALAEAEKQAAAEKAAARAKERTDREEQQRAELAQRAADRDRKHAPLRHRIAELRASLGPLLSPDDIRALAASAIARARITKLVAERSATQGAAQIEIDALYKQIGEAPARLPRVRPLSIYITLEAVDVALRCSTWAAFRRAPEIEGRPKEQALELVVAIADAGGPNLVPRKATDEESALLARVRDELRLAREREETTRVRLLDARRRGGGFRIAEPEVAAERAHDTSSAKCRSAMDAERQLVAELESQNVDVE